VRAPKLAARIGLDAELIPTRETSTARRSIVAAGRLVEIPGGFSLTAPRILRRFFEVHFFRRSENADPRWKPFIAAHTGDDDESLDSFVTRRLGREVLDRVAQALAGGIYTADPKAAQHDGDDCRASSRWNGVTAAS